MEAFVVARQFFWRKYVDRKKTFVTSNLVLLQRTSLWTFEQNWHFAKKRFCQKIIFCEFENIYSKSFKLFFQITCFMLSALFRRLKNFFELFIPYLNLNSHTHTYGKLLVEPTPSFFRDVICERAFKLLWQQRLHVLYLPYQLLKILRERSCCYCCSCYQSTCRLVFCQTRT